MVLAITATPDASLAAVRFDVTGGAGPFILTAYPTGSPSYVVRTMWTLDANVWHAIDGDIPIDVPTSYTVTDTATGATAATGAVTVSSASPVLSDALDPTRTVRIPVVSQTPDEWQARSVWWDVLGTRAPFVSVAPLRYRNGDLVLYVADRTERDAALAVLTSGSPFVLRTPCRDRVDDIIGLPERVSADTVVNGEESGPFTVTITYQAVARELGPYVGQGGRTYAVALAESATYDVVLSTFASFRDWLAGVPR